MLRTGCSVGVCRASLRPGVSRKTPLLEPKGYRHEPQRQSPRPSPSPHSPPRPALAHHPLEGAPMETLAQGLLSGVGHPILGFDHLFFVAAMGIAALFTAARLAGPVAYVLAMVLGCGAAYAGLALPAVEIVITASLLTVGGLLASGRTLSTTGHHGPLSQGSALFHGAAFRRLPRRPGRRRRRRGPPGLPCRPRGDAIPRRAGRAASSPPASSMPPRPPPSTPALVGAAVAGVGVFLALEVLRRPPSSPSSPAPDPRSQDILTAPRGAVLFP